MPKATNPSWSVRRPEWPVAMKLRDLEYLIAVADHRHFGRAADACFVSQPTLSTQIKKLEQELGVELIERNPRAITLTEVGSKIVERARVAIGETEAIHAIARQSADPESGSVRLGIFPTLAPYLLPHVVGAIRQRFPNLELLLVEEKTDEVVQRLRDGRLDAGILAVPIHEPNLVSESLFDEDFLLAMPRGHAMATTSDPVAVEALGTENMLLLEEGHCLRDQALRVCALTGATEHRGFRATSLETLRQMVAAGVGMTLLPELALLPPVTPSPDVVLRRFADQPPQRSIAMFWRPTSVLRTILPEIAAIVRDEVTPLVSSHRPD